MSEKVEIIISMIIQFFEAAAAYGDVGFVTFIATVALICMAIVAVRRG